MHVTVLTVGSRGDIQPYIALALGLKAAGHQVCLATEANYRAWVTQYGLEFAELPGDSAARHASPAWREFIDAAENRNILRSTLTCNLKFVLPTLSEQLDATWLACQGTDAIVSMPSVFASYHVAEKLGVPFYNVWTNPVTTTKEFPHSWSRLPRQRWLGGAINEFSYSVLLFLFLQTLWKPIHQWRQEKLGLPAFTAADGKRANQVPWLYAYSPSVLPKPADWAAAMHVTGYWFLPRPAAWQPADRLVDFLQAGAPPIYVGFGSTANRDPIETTQLVVAAIERTGQRAILDAGWAGVGNIELPPTIYAMQSHEGLHEWLLPQVAAVVHHGGNGTTGAALQAGKPNIVVHPALTDCGFWGQQIAELGAGPQPIPRSQLTVDRLAKAIHQAVTDQVMGSQAAAIGERIRAEDGVANAVAVFHHYLPGSVQHKLELGIDDKCNLAYQ